MATNLLENKILGLIRTLGAVTVTELVEYTHHKRTQIMSIVEKNIKLGKIEWGKERES
ncbi:MAG: hypothetical protein ACW963_06370 [Candidatus Sifarchaeia archaeon]|jgi:hypothetical protein